MRRMYLCSDTVTGIFSAIYDAWQRRQCSEGMGIAIRGNMEQELFCEYYEVRESEKKADAVARLIRKHLGEEAYTALFRAALSDDAHRGDAILGTMLAARNVPDSRKILDQLSHPEVEKVFELSRSVGLEAHHYNGFIRFRELTNGVLFSEIEPKSKVLPCIAEHFENRLPLEHFLIYDKKHKMFLVHEAGKKSILVKGEELNTEMTAKISSAEDRYEQLWQGFFESIWIRERTNPVLQRNLLPLRFRENMVEFGEKQTSCDKIL